MILNEYETNSQCFCWRFQSNQLLIQKIWGNLEIFVGVFLKPMHNMWERDGLLKEFTMRIQSLLSLHQQEPHF